MTSDSSLSLSTENNTPELSVVSKASHVRLKTEADKVLLILSSLPTVEDNTSDLEWSEVWQELKSRLNGNEDQKPWQAGASVMLVAKDFLLDGRQLQTVAEILTEAELQLKSVRTSRRQTAVAAAMAGYSVEKTELNQHLLSEAEIKPEKPKIAEPLYLQTTVRSGAEIRHPSTVIIFGDLNPGGSIVAAGDIFVWGRLRGIAHAGAEGNRECRIMALRMEATQLRIADLVARAPAAPAQFEPEIAYITAEGIRVAKGFNFLKTHTFVEELAVWTDA